MSDILQRIRDLQLQDKDMAESLLLTFLADIYPEPVSKVELRPLAVSLNSFNGFMTLKNGKRYFFKTHTESDTVINEYYNAGMLAQAGYPMIRPVFQSTEPGKQFLVYELIESPSVFDLAWQIENGNDEDFHALKDAQIRADQALYGIYQQTLQPVSDLDNSSAPVHQLFYHRLTGGRLQRFYRDQPTFSLPDQIWETEEVFRWRWCVNGQEYHESIDDIIDRAVQLLDPQLADYAVVGHGDAHNGNVFAQKTATDLSLVYFDPAFAGKHHPLIDLVKPLFHNVFAMWMYYPQEKAQTLSISLGIADGICTVHHDYELHPVRRMFLESKLKYVLVPLVKHLHSKGMLRANWRPFIKSGLFCCPFLTMNLADTQRFPPEIALLGLAMSVEMGSESTGKQSRIDSVLDEIESDLG